MKTDQGARASNIELCRIIAMLMIVLSHYTWFGLLKSVNADACKVWTTGSIINKVFSSLSILGGVGVGIFFIITGYFSVEKNKPQSLKKVCNIALFYVLIALLVMVGGYVCGNKLLPTTEMILLGANLIFTPFTGSVWWFFTAYLFLIVFSTQINDFFHKVNKKGVLFCIFLLLVFGYVLGNLGSNFYDFEKAITFYFIGAFFRNYFDNEANIGKYALYSIIGILINGGLYYLLFSLTATHGASIFTKLISMMVLCNEPLVAASIFAFFLRLTFNNSLINVIASHTFGVYLFHEAPYTRSLLWGVLFRPSEFYDSRIFIITSIVIVIVVFLIGIILDIFRKKFIESKIGGISDRIIMAFRNRCYR